MLLDSPSTPIEIPNHPVQVAWMLFASLPEVGLTRSARWNKSTATTVHHEHDRNPQMFLI